MTVMDLWDKTGHSGFFCVFVSKTGLFCAVERYCKKVFKIAKKEHKAQLEEKTMLETEVVLSISS